MNLLLTSDWHLSDNPRDAYRWNTTEEIAGLVEQFGIDTVAILGDLTQDPDGHSGALVNRIVDLLVRLAPRVLVVRGNHDGNDPANPFFRFLNQTSSVRMVVDTEIHDLDGTRTALIPHGQWPDDPRLLADIDLILTHATFTGAIAENGTALPGLRLPMHCPPIYSGDVHVPQQQGMVTYVGAPTHQRFGDTFEPRVIVMQGHAVQPISLYGPTKQLVRVVADPQGRLTWDSTPVGIGDLVKVEVSFSGSLPPFGHLRADIAAAITNAGAQLHAIIPVTEKRTTPMPAMPTQRDDRSLVQQYSVTRGFDQDTVDAGLAVIEAGPVAL